MSAVATPAGVSLVMAMYNEAGDIGDVLTSLSNQRYPHEAMHLIVVDGGSTDGSLEIVRAWLARGDVGGEIVHNPQRTIPTSLNAGIARCRVGDIVIRLDAHTLYDADYVGAIARAFEEAPADVACVGGTMSPDAETRFSRRLVCALYTNPMGLGGADFRRNGAVRVVGNVYLGAWRSGIVPAVGGFDTGWEANEDGELAARLRRNGYRTLLIPVRSAYRVKRGPLAVVKQWGRYGYWRAQTLRRYPAEWRLRHLVPPVGLVFALLLLATPLRGLVGLLYAAYAAAVFAKRAPGEPLAVTLASCVFFPACQLTWTAGLLRGLATPMRPAAQMSARNSLPG
jgi:glycosyltransferase involved in cell wall biosynthesis